nr:alpha/beta hydrolases superfamily protein [Tanacetum cinerariifolium]
MDEALVPHAKRLRIGRSNFCLLSDIRSKESTLQLVYDATTTVHHHSIRSKMDNKKHIVNLESFKDMLHICLRLPGQSFIKPPFEEEILAFLCFLRHSRVIRKLTDVNINKLNRPWRSFAVIINKCLTGKSSGYDSLRLNIKIQRKAMRCIILGSRRLSSTTSCQRILLFQEETRNSYAYKEYYAVATGATPPKPKASVRKTRSSSDSTITPPIAAAGPRLTTSKKGKQTAKASKANSLSALSETGTIPGVPDVPTDESEEDISWKSTDDEGDDDKENDGDDDDDGDDGEKGDGDDDEDNDDDDDDQEDERDDDKDDEEKGGDDEQASNEEEFIHPSLRTHTEEEPRDEESYSSKSYVRKFLRALHPKWKTKDVTIKESKNLTSLSLDELIENYKVHEVIIKKDYEIVKAKGERKSLTIKAKKESSDEESLTSISGDEEYVMVARDSKKFFKRRGRFVRQPRNDKNIFQRSRDDKNIKYDRKCFRCGDPNHLIIECLKPSKDKNQRAFVEGSWSDNGEEDDEKAKDETCRMAYASSEAKKKSSNEESLTSGSEDEEYAMAVRDFKKFFKRRGRFVRQPRNDKKTFQRSRDDKNDKSDRKCFRCEDPNHVIKECPKPPRDKNQKAFNGGSWSDSGEVDDESLKTKLVSWLMHLA